MLAIAIKVVFKTALTCFPTPALGLLESVLLGVDAAGWNCRSRLAGFDVRSVRSLLPADQAWSRAELAGSWGEEY